jgi:predicted enzyme related to lactoylglutathione lyase
MANPVVHFEITGPDGDALRAFYSEIFGWEISVMKEPMDYGSVGAQDGKGIGGGVAQSEHAGVTVYVEVDDPAEVLARIAEAGGETVQDVTEVPDIVTFAMFRDPQGNVIGLVKGGGGEEHEDEVEGEEAAG